MIKILLVDDEPQILELMELLFDWKKLGFHIVGTAHNGLEALEILKEKTVDILITDVNMPHMDGLALIKATKSLYPHMSTVILSAYDDFQYAKKALALRVEDYLLKPIQEKEFLQIMENLKEKHQKHDLYPTTIQNEHNYIRSNLLNRLIKNRISYLELEEKLQFINLSLNHACYNLVIIKLKTPIKFGSLVTKLSSYLDISVDTFELFEDFDNNLVLLFGNDNNEKLTLSLQQNKDMVLPALEEENVDYIISTGILVNDILDIYKSYIHAQRLSGEIIIQNEALHFTNKDLFQETPNSIITLVNFKKLKKLLLDSNYTDAYKFVILSFPVYKEDEPLPFDANNLALRFVTWVDNFYNDFNVVLEESSQYYDYLILGILQSTTTHELSTYIIDHIQLYKEQKADRNKRYSPIISQIKAYVDEHYKENISLKGLSSKYHVNPSYLGQLFNKEIGEYFNDYLNRLKNEKALELLLITDMTNYEIAMALGYTEASYFYKKFKAYHGEVPNTFRKKRQ